MKLKLTALSLAALLAVCGVSSVLPGIAVTAYAEDSSGGSMGSLGNVYGDYLYKAYDDHVEITATSVRAAGDLFVPDEIDGLPVTAVGEHAFASNMQITSVTLPETVTSIGRQAFYMSTRLLSVNLPAGVTEIGEEAFLCCDKLTELSLPASLTSIGTRAFYSCSGLTELILPENLISIGEYAFQSCTGLTSMTIPDGITEIPGGAFMSCIGLTELVLPANVTSTGQMSIPDSVTRLTIVNPDCVLDESLAYRSESSRKLVTIIAPEGSQAQAFAEEYGFSFEALGSSPIEVETMGDINHDGELSVLDVVALQKWLLGKGSLPNWKAADFNQDNIINIFDLCLIKRTLLNQKTIIPTAKELSAGIASQEVTGADADEVFISGQTAFYLSLLQNTVEEGKNSLISPYSVEQALGMTANGASGETKSQMEQTLGGMEIEKLNAYLYTQRISQPNEENCKLKTANSIWYRDAEGLNVFGQFLQTNADYYQASAFKAPFDATTLKDINTWVSRNTDGMIPSILNEISDTAVMYLINAVTFDAKWQSAYTDDDIYESSFTSSEGILQTAKMMYSEEDYYLKDENAVGFYKYYSGGRYAFAALLPDEDITVTEYVQNLTPERLHQTLANPEPIEVYAVMPEFSYDYDVELSAPLSSMGMPLAFGEEADFSAMMSPSAYIDQVLHKTFIDVSPKGTKAAAVTIVAPEPMESEHESVRLNRPFVYCIVDTETYLPVFMGVLNSIPE